jgi:hypothetical protein
VRFVGKADCSSCGFDLLECRVCGEDGYGYAFWKGGDTPSDWSLGVEVNGERIERVERVERVERFDERGRGLAEFQGFENPSGVWDLSEGTEWTMQMIGE